jgi:hypothetical protein
MWFANVKLVRLLVLKALYTTSKELLITSIAQEIYQKINSLWQTIKTKEEIICVTKDRKTILSVDDKNADKFRKHY